MSQRITHFDYSKIELNLNLGVYLHNNQPIIMATYGIIIGQSQQKLPTRARKVSNDHRVGRFTLILILLSTAVNS